MDEGPWRDSCSRTGRLVGIWSGILADSLPRTRKLGREFPAIFFYRLCHLTPNGYYACISRLIDN